MRATLGRAFRAEQAVFAVRFPAIPIQHWRNAMRTFILAGAAALSLAVGPAALSAQAGGQPASQPAPQTADQANARAQPPPPTTEVIDDGDPQTPATIVENNPGNLTPPPASAFNKTYPVCTRTLQDNCQNPGEGGAPGRSRALGYWPGKPASEK